MQQNIINRDFLPVALSQKAIKSTFIALYVINAIFIQYYTPIPMLVLIFGTVVFFFGLLHFHTQKWQHISGTRLYKNLFWYSLLYRFIFIGILYLYTWIYDPKSLPLEMFARDAWGYQAAGTAIMGKIFNLEFLHILPHFYRSHEDWGFPVWIGFCYTYLFESIAVIKVLNSLIGSFTVVLLAKIANLLYSQRHAALSGVMAMLMPALMWYGAMYLKETIMIFLIVLVVYHAIKIVRIGKFSILSIASILLAVPALYYFRAVISALLFLSLLLYFFFNFILKGRSNKIALVALILLIIGIFHISADLGQQEKIREQYEEMDSIAERGLGAKTNAVKNISIATRLAVPLVAANAFFAPYPSFLNMDERQIGVISHAHIEVVRILVYYFGFIGLLLLMKRDMVNSSLILSFGAGYILVLALTGRAIDSRMNLPAVPFIILFASAGFLDSSKKWFAYYDRYLIGIWAVVLMWHIFKLSIRGML